MFLRAGAYPRGDLLKGIPLLKALALHANITQGLPGSNTIVANGRHKQFSEFVFTTFNFLLNLEMGLIS